MTRDNHREEEYHLIQERIAALEEALRRTKQKAVIGELTQGFCHNLKTPINLITGHLEMLKWHLSSIKNIDLSVLAAVQDSMEAIESACSRVADMTQNLLLKSRREESSDKQEVSFNSLILREIKFLEADSFFRNHVKVSLDLAEGLPLKNLLYNDWSQGFGNLVRNALEAMTDTTSPQITIKTFASESEIGWEVHDSGPGIPLKQRKDVWEAFFSTKRDEKAAPHKKNLEGSRGLGLYWLRNLVEEHGGSVEIDTSYLGGALFRIRLPL